MTVVQNSWLYQTVWLRLLRWSRGSVLLAWLARADGALMRGVRDSALCRFVSRPGCLNRAWEGSLICRAIDWAANCVPRGLHWCYSRTSGLWAFHYYIMS